MLVVTVPIEAFRRALEQAGENIDAAEDRILETAGDELVELLERDFERKSRGGAGADGTTWDRDKLTPGKTIGVKSGEMKKKIVTRQSGEALEILYGVPWARHFDKTRELIPNRMPDVWEEKLDEAAAPLVDDAVETALEPFL